MDEETEVEAGEKRRSFLQWQSIIRARKSSN